MKIEGKNVLINGCFQPATIIIEEGKIIEIINEATAEATEDYIVPGFIDVHYHGCYMANAMDEPLKSLEVITKKSLLEGTTSVYPTTTSLDRESVKQALKDMAEYYHNQPVGHANMLGIHLEGPFLAEDFAGAQQTQYFEPCSSELFTEYQQAAEGLIKYITIAPEKDAEMTLIKELSNQGIVVSIGHTGCSYEEAMAAIDNGATSATHLFNSMKKMAHHDPGVLTAVLIDDRVYTQLTVDGLHVSFPTVKLTLRSKGTDKIVLITDSNSAKGMLPGEYNLNGRIVLMDETGAVRVKKNNSLAGSTACLNKCVSNLVNYCEVSIADACKMASENVAKLMNISTKGLIKLGYDADIIFLDKDFNVTKAIVNGIDC